MKMYRIVEQGETLISDTFVPDLSAYIRPIRPVEDLTDEEIIECWNSYGCNLSVTAGVKAVLLKADELRSRPKASEKERWIREYLGSSYAPGGTYEKALSETWDAAYEAGRKNKLT